ncbi:MAG: beta-ketoacyl synthase N-terminal-like domain-containing protein [Myxococcota bacterium]
MIVATGAHAVVREPGASAPLDPLPYLRQKKTRKFMGVQDDLAVLAAGAALERAGISRAGLGERAGLFAVVGYIPFDQADIAPVLAASLDGERFSMQRFSNGGFQQAHPLLTFRCLPNMPAYHVSANFDVRGPYFVTYPGPGQLYAALEEACLALESGRIDVALLFAVAHQRNFLVEHHFERLEPPTRASELRDAGACLVLEHAERAEREQRQPLLALLNFEHGYQSHAALEGAGAEQERFVGVEAPAGALGPAALLCALASATAERGAREISHRLASRDGIRAHSRWQVLS